MGVCCLTRSHLLLGMTASSLPRVLGGAFSFMAKPLEIPEAQEVRWSPWTHTAHISSLSLSP